ncbi:class I SAM-dependent methyltransferase [Pengzhenrongella frigida]|uniref:Class I SAM-dependent methyltransferase n=1 Tax=Pengzhenrongella frigida TaxID=1259133 RepID=A0A4Q5N2Z2_9MICO|nr:class I SAM-dependent methyltransferase [Cellulomonas sp. HLT2-17]RYV51623.1 class I SAM-dependent methyltransferase [Cellulomonas sp. HLT2-17]
MRHATRWEDKTTADPNHSTWYVERFRRMVADGADLAGEARMIDALIPRGSRVLDAGCGPGRVGAELAARGHLVTGVDVDPVLIEAARADHPRSEWLLGDLAELDLPARGVLEPFDVAVAAGNVMTFLAPGTEVEVLSRLAAHVRADGRVVLGFGAGRGYAFEDFFADLDRAGLRLEAAFSTWDLRPFTSTSDFVVAVTAPASA